MPWMELTIYSHPAEAVGQRMAINLDHMTLIAPLPAGGTALWRDGWEVPITVCEPYSYVRGGTSGPKLSRDGHPEAIAPLKPADRSGQVIAFPRVGQEADY